jgi:DNA-binding NtrC family response regulator
MRMDDGDGLQVMQGVRTQVPGTPVILLTAYGSVPGAVQAIREGACEYLQKPVVFADLLAVVEEYLESGAGEASSDGGIGNSHSYQTAVERAKRVATTDADVLIEAESGTGKELLARMIHRESKRKNGPFVAVNCSAFPENLLESELFGHVRGAFTGASMAKPGKFELANGGTLLLDEIGEMPMSLQPKLLRVLQEREVDRLGDTRAVKVDVRVIATTNRSLEQQVEAGEFRADLFYRLNVVPLTAPPLRERREDILPLAKYFVRKYEDKSQGVAHIISPELATYL